MCSFGTIENPNMNGSSAHTYSRAKPFSGRDDTLAPRRIILMDFAVREILRRRSQTKIRYAIIAGVAVDVIDHPRGQLPVGKKPHEPMR